MQILEFPSPRQAFATAETPAENCLPFLVARYHLVLTECFSAPAWREVQPLADALLTCWRDGRQAFVCGHGDGLRHAEHLTAELNTLFSTRRRGQTGPVVQVLRPAAHADATARRTASANQDLARQLTALAYPGDLLITMSDDGDDAAINAALRSARRQGLESWAVVGGDGGDAIDDADHPLHFPVADPAVATDLQMIFGHLLVQHLRLNLR